MFLRPTWRDIPSLLWWALCDALTWRRASTPPPDPLDPGGPDGSTEGPRGMAPDRHCATCTCHRSHGWN